MRDYNRFTILDAWNLCAPHTWPASIFPVLLAISITIAQGFAIAIITSIVLLLISICMQSAVNALNDYFDCVKGTDSLDDNLEASDSVLLSKSINPKCALYLAITLVICALLLGIYCIIIAGFIPLAIAAIGILAIALYSGGKTPISYLPIGELVSGLVMGMLITLASYIVLTKSIDWMVLVWSIPEVIGIALIMMTNNTCDIEKDIKANRRTLPTILGRPRARDLYRTLVVCWNVAIIAIGAIFFAQGLIVCIFMVVASYPIEKALFMNPLEQSSRIAAMSQICSMNIALGTFYCFAIACSAAGIVLV